jgi:hypothetical protein
MCCTESDLRDILEAKALLGRVLRNAEQHQSRLVREEAAAKEALREQHAGPLDEFEERN